MHVRACWRIAAVLVAAVATFVPVTPAAAIIGGTVDGNGHPYAGSIVGGAHNASGVLISPTVYLTAGHVTRRLENAGITRTRVTFDPVVSSSSTWYWGTVHTNPAYDPSSVSDPGDLGVVVFDSPIPGITPASLPTLGLLDALGPQGLSGQTFTVVGYGATAYLPNGGGPPQPDLNSGGTRKVAHETFLSFTSDWLRLGEHLDGSPCTLDSGAPSLLGASNVIAGITIRGTGQCDGTPQWDIRVDTPAARAFLGQYVTLP
jgi:hypothetical protein